MIALWILYIGLAILSAVLYRLGGWGDEGRQQFPNLPKWLFNTKARDVGCAVCCFIGMLFIGGAWSIFNLWYWVVAFFSFGLLFGALTTYWDFLSVRFTPTGRSYLGEDNHWMHGFMCGLAYFPYAVVSHDWVGFGVRCIALAILMGAVSKLSGNDVVEETGRGAVLVLTLPIFLIF